MSGKEGVLLDEVTLVVQPSLVRALGSIADAMMLQQVHHRTVRPYHGDVIVEDAEGRRYVQRSLTAWADETGLSRDQVKRSMTALEAAGLILRVQVPGWDRTYGYAVDRARLDVLLTSQGAESPHGDPRGGIAPSQGAESPHEQGAESPHVPTRSFERTTKGSEADASVPAVAVKDSAKDPVKAHAREIVRAWWDWHQERHNGKAPTVQPFIACVKVVEQCLRAGTSEQDVKYALIHAPVVSAGAFQVTWSKRDRVEVESRPQWQMG
jgi:DNA-binding Lrp family transcriptional regulator